ncbi:DHA2 family multidrug resistance protein-like MFS transporter [Tamaricihabitans halophyticus]|uniref:DHA2 family multidrug resistance protein-like MFS transporter n=1 Tax=Tamaricihabitans halophyticus TaxID=1262583 RepID=A0A4R2QUY5_9PSEU|nr:MFS transporter [Tamaricihabitans halophyticus]TCP53537.1 DHA2 family multidrug resistance protein-like MFS transporter [Tamaricihabitans halophyticus]
MRNTTSAAGIREWSGLAVLALPTALLGLDVTVLYLALPALAEDLRPSATETLWIMDAYGFLIAGLLITMGNVGDRIGRRKLLLIGATAFGVASVLAAYAPNAELLITARAALGVAGATLMPATLSLITNLFHNLRQRALAIGIWAMMFALGMAAGPLVGGVLLERFWWGSAFLVAIPLILVLLVTAPFLLPEYRAPRAGRFDLLSVALSMLAILPVIYAVKRAAKDGFQLPTVLAALLGVAMAVVFVRRQRRLTDPLLDVRLFASRTFSAALGLLLIGLVGVGGVMFLVTQHLQLVEELSPFHAGLWMGPPALATLVASIVAPLLARRFRPGYVVTGTLGLSTVGYLLLTQVSGAGNIPLVVAGFAFVYLGLGAIAALGTDLVVGSAPPARAGSASALSETVQELGLAIGVAVLGSLATVVYRTQLHAQLPGDLPAETTETATENLSGATAVADQLPEDARQAAADAFTSGLNVTALVAGIGILLLAVLSGFTLRGTGATKDTPPEEPSSDPARAGQPCG